MVRIDDSGVQDVRLREAPIPWQAIASVHVMPRQQALLLFLRDKSYMKPRRLDFGFGPVSRLVLRDGDRVLDEQLTVTIPLSNLSPGVEDAWNFVKAHYRTWVCEPPGSNPFAVPAGQPLSWPLRSLFQKHVCAHADGLLMVRMGIVNLAAAVRCSPWTQCTRLF